MPSPRNRKKLCIFGDSQIGCIKKALTQKKYTTRRALDFEFWGADGPRFRGIDQVGATMVPRAEVLETVLLVNGQGREVLDPADFDAILFMGARVRTSDFFPPLLHQLQQPAGYLSKAVFRQQFLDWLPKNRYYRAAKAMAAQGQAEIFLAPSTFITEGFEHLVDVEYAGALHATGQNRQKIWDQFREIAAMDGITIIPQPEETITNGCMTRKEFGNITVDGKLDPTHRDAVYGAMILKHTVELFYS